MAAIEPAEAEGSGSAPPRLVSLVDRDLVQKRLSLHGGRLTCKDGSGGGGLRQQTGGGGESRDTTPAPSILGAKRSRDAYEADAGATTNNNVAVTTANSSGHARSSGGGSRQWRSDAPSVQTRVTDVESLLDVGLIPAMEDGLEMTNYLSECHGVLKGVLKSYLADNDYAQTFAGDGRGRELLDTWDHAVMDNWDRACEIISVGGQTLKLGADKKAPSRNNSADASLCMLFYVNVCFLRTVVYDWHRPPEDAHPFALPEVVGSLLVVCDKHVRDYTLGDVLFACMTLQSKLYGLRLSSQLLTYVRWLELQAARLVGGAGPSSVYDSLEFRSHLPGTALYTCNKAAISTLALLLYTFRRMVDHASLLGAMMDVDVFLEDLHGRWIEDGAAADRSRRDWVRDRRAWGDDQRDEFYVSPGWSRRALLADTELLVSPESGAYGRFEGVLERAFSLSRSSTFMQTFRDWIKRFVIWPGTRELCRLSTRSSANSNEQYLEHQWSTAERHFLRSFFDKDNFHRILKAGIEGAPSEPGLRVACGEEQYYGSLLVLYLFNRYTFMQFKFEMIGREFLAFEDVWDANLPKLARSSYPVILQIFNEFHVYCDERVVRAPSVKAALYYWCYFMWRFSDGDVLGQYDMVNFFNHIFGKPYTDDGDDSSGAAADLRSLGLPDSDSDSDDPDSGRRRLEQQQQGSGAIVEVEAEL